MLMEMETFGAIWTIFVAAIFHRAVKFYESPTKFEDKVFFFHTHSAAIFSRGNQLQQSQWRRFFLLQRKAISSLPLFYIVANE
jgi:hypothetical protein